MPIGQLNTFQREETVVCSIVVTDADDTQVDPATSMKITIEDPEGTAVVNNQDMTNDAVGEYHYDYTSAADAELGRYTITYIATDAGPRVTIQCDKFWIEEGC